MVAMAMTYNGKSRNCQFVLFQLGYLDFFLQKCLLSSPLRFICILSKSLILIGCQGDKKGEFLKNIKKSSPQKP